MRAKINQSCSFAKAAAISDFTFSASETPRADLHFALWGSMNRISDAGISFSRNILAVPETGQEDAAVVWLNNPHYSLFFKNRM